MGLTPLSPRLPNLEPYHSIHSGLIPIPARPFQARLTSKQSPNSTCIHTYKPSQTHRCLLQEALWPSPTTPQHIMLRVTIELLHRITLAPEKIRVRNLALLALPARINSNDGFGAHVFDCFDVLQSSQNNQLGLIRLKPNAKEKPSSATEPKKTQGSKEMV